MSQLVDVIINRKAQAVDHVFTYRLSEELAAKAKIGQLVKVPFQRQTVEAIIVAFSSEAPAGKTLRYVKEICAEAPLLGADLLQLSRFMADYYLCPWVSAIQAMLPAGLHLSGTLPAYLFQNIYTAAAEMPKLTAKQSQLYALVKDNPALEQGTILNAGFSRDMLNNLVKGGALIKEQQRIDLGGNLEQQIEPSDLNQAQNKAYQAIKAEWGGQNRPYLLFGITGSGKTEIYLRLIADICAQNKQAIVLVPEIALAGQMLAMLRQRLPYRIEILHSGLNAGQRRAIWQDIAENKVEVIVGARSAIFAPTPNLGLIIIDEEHETAYKQEHHPRFEAKTIALERSRQSQAHLLLGSATPAVETYFMVKTKAYAFSYINQQYHNSLPAQVAIVDMRKELRDGNRSLFSVLAKKAIEQALNDGEQAIIFLNRRGYYQFFSCRSCGEAIICPHCQVAMSYHLSGGGILKCHYCGRQQKPPKLCPICGSKHIRSFGQGTQKIEAQLNEYFPQAKVLRLDSDTTAQKGAHNKIYQAMREGEADILVGTQMVAKGLDFAKVSLAIALAADSLLNLPDWRANERTFQLLNQLCGRAGRRNKQGQAIIQTYNPQALAIISAAKRDYGQFYQEEIAQRENHFYPPFAHIVRLLLLGNEQQQVHTAIKRLKFYLDENLSQDQQICGPAAAPIAKIKDQWRWQIIIKSPDLACLRPQLNQAIITWQKEESKLAAKMRLSIDIDAHSVL